MAQGVPESHVRSDSAWSGLLEREGELAALRLLVGDACAGRGGVGVVQGPSGVGKSRLLEAGREEALAAGMQVLRARASELELDYPFGVVRRLFEPALALHEDPDILLSGAARLARHLVDPTAAPSAGAEDRFAVLHGLYWLTASLTGDRPLLLLVDDLQWCDPPSLLFLAYLAVRIEDLPVALLVAARDGESVREPAAFEEVTASGSASRLRPIPLSEEAVRDLVRAALAREPDGSFVLACYSATGGNPLLLHELLGALVAADVVPSAESVPQVPEIGADAVSHFVDRRLRRLSENARRLASAAAVLGEQTDLEEVAALSELTRPLAADAAAALVRADVLRGGTPLGFVHPLVREAVYTAIAPSERERTHARAIAVLGERGASRARVAVHLLHVSPNAVPCAVTILRDTAQRSLAEGAPSGAVAFLERALAEDLAPALRAALLRDAGDAALRVDPRSALRYLEESLSLVAEPTRRSETELLLGRALYASGRSDQAVRVFERALLGLPATATDLGYRLEYELSNALVGSVRLEDAVEHARRWYEQPPTGEGGGSRSLLATLAWLAAFLPRTRPDAVRLASAALAGGLLLEEEDSDALWTAAIVFLTAEEFERARATVEQALERAVARGSAQGFTWSAYYRARLSSLLGELDDAEADARSALEAVESHGIAAAAPWAASALGDVLLERGRPEEAWRIAGSRAALDRESVHSLLLLTRAEALVALRRPEEALADLEEIDHRYERAGRDNRGTPWRPTAARVLAALGQREQALALATEEIELARSWGATRALGRALRVAGTLKRGAGGLELLQEAVTVLEDSPARLEHAHALADLGSALRRAGRRTDAREPLRRALELATFCGATPVAERAETELLATGARPRRVALSGVDSLTPSERRVASMAAEGMSNREIAQALFVTLRTVEMHLSNAFRKLDIASRTQLPAALKT